ncbi:MAG: hypothetical protein QXO51_03975 [Halobacteria archaeon]
MKPEEVLHELTSRGGFFVTVNNGNAVCEARLEPGAPLRFRDGWATLNDEKRPWHIHAKLEAVREVRFAIETHDEKSGRKSYSVQFLGEGGGKVFAAYFADMYDGDGKLKEERLQEFQNLRDRYGRR